jgi:hypothetical protein
MAFDHSNSWQFETFPYRPVSNNTDKPVLIQLKWGSTPEWLNKSE